MVLKKRKDKKNKDELVEESIDDYSDDELVIEILKTKKRYTTQRLEKVKRLIDEYHQKKEELETLADRLEKKIGELQQEFESNDS